MSEATKRLTIARLSFVSGRDYSAGKPGVTLYRTHWTDGGALTLCGRNIDAERMERLGTPGEPTCGRCRDRRKQDEIAGELLEAMARRKPMGGTTLEIESATEPDALTQQELDRLNAELQQEHELYLNTLETEMP